MKPIRVGTDCSGIEAPIEALKRLKIPYIHVFSSEIDKHCVETIEANYDPEIIYTDIKKRDPRRVPDIDLYVCGFPCQPFSSIGRRGGVSDRRGEIIFSCIELIRIKRPQFFILENVPGFLTIDDGALFNHVMESLGDIPGYKIKWSIMNTKDYGIPQNRQRLYIVGSRGREFHWPRPIKSRKLISFVDFSDDEAQSIPLYIHRDKTLERIPRNSIFINLSFPKDNFPNANRVAPCLLTGGDLWCVPLQRRANIKEYLSLQGFPRSFKQVVSDSQLKKQIGNSMSVCVIKAILSSLLPETESVRS